MLDPDADVVTLAAEASRPLTTKGKIGALFLGTQTSPYLSRSAAAVLADILGLGPDVFAADVQFASKSGTAALAMAIAWVKAGFCDRALAVGADALCLHAAPGDPLEMTAGAGAVSVLVGAEDIAARFEGISSVSSDTADGFRLQGDPYIRSGGPGLTSSGAGDLSHMSAAWRALKTQLGQNASFARIALQQADARNGNRIARALGVDIEHCIAGEIAAEFGDLGSASSLAALMLALESGQPGERVGVVSYGQGAGADALSFQVDKPIVAGSIRAARARRTPVNYATAVRWEGRYRRHDNPLSVFE
ncbi:hypothetical protein ABE453_13025 [Brevundimonas diminuta]|uniref:hypothetical protein n=1 Tax=Brevundimonas diminuta TaxID=293 RepID=UPI0032081AC0